MVHHTTGHEESAAVHVPWAAQLVVAAAEQQRGMGDGKEPSHDAENVVFTGRAHGYSKVR